MMLVCPNDNSEFDTPSCPLCGWAPEPPKKKKGAAVQCHTLECEGEGCHVMIRRLLSEPIPSLCKWCMAKLPRQDVPVKPPPPESDGREIDREEFGLQLFATIKAIGELAQIKENLADPHVLRRTPERKQKAWAARQNALLADLPQMMQELPEHQARDVFARYPWIFE